MHAMSIRNCLILGVPLTRVPHEFARDLLVAAAAAEDLTTQSAVVASAESCELLIAVITLLTLAVWHPVLLQIAVLGGDKTITNSF